MHEDVDLLGFDDIESQPASPAVPTQPTGNGSSLIAPQSVEEEEDLLGAPEAAQPTTPAPTPVTPVSPEAVSQPQVQQQAPAVNSSVYDSMMASYHQKQGMPQFNQAAMPHVSAPYSHVPQQLHYAHTMQPTGQQQSTTVPVHHVHNHYPHHLYSAHGMGTPASPVAHAAPQLSAQTSSNSNGDLFGHFVMR